MACIIYYDNLDYDKLPTARKRPRMMTSNNVITNQTRPITANNQTRPYPPVPTPNNYRTTNSTNGFTSASSTTTTTVLAESIQSYDISTETSTRLITPPKSVSSADSSSSSNDDDLIILSPDDDPPGNRPITTTATNLPPRTASGYPRGLANSTGNSYSSRCNSANYSNPPVIECRPSNNNFQNGRSNTSLNRETSNDYRSAPSRSWAQASRPSSSFECPPKEKLYFTLERFFKFTAFRKNQLEAVEATCHGKDTLVLMPTGGGKSICYQLPGILSPGVTIVVSPLKSLIEDQVTRLRSLHITSSALFGETKEAEAATIYRDLSNPEPEHKLLYVTPEKISASSYLNSLFQSMHQIGRLSRFVIDEAHCVSMWGSDFRPDYRKLGCLRKNYPGVPVMALTATAPPKVREDIIDQLHMDRSNCLTLIQSFNRPNLKFEVKSKGKGCLSDICSLIKNKFKGQCGIVYCLSRRDCELVSDKLREFGVKSSPYHAGIKDEKRRNIFQAWSAGTFQVVCATIAFGMGIDKSNVRFVIHYSVPKSIEGYYQEAGRAGRDGKFASCILFYAKSDLYRMRSMLSKGLGRSPADKLRDETNLEHIVGYGENKTECRRVILLKYLGEAFNRGECISKPETACDNCLLNR